MAQKDRDDHRQARPLGRRRLRHPQHRQPAGAARPGPAQQARRGRDPRVARGLPVDPADPPRLRLRRLGVDLGGLQQHLHVLHRAEPARQGAGPPAGRDPRRGRGARRPGRRRGHPARPERQHLRRRVRRPARVRQAAACLRRGRGPGAGALHQPAPGGLHRRRHRGDGRDPERDAEPAHAAAVGLGPGAQGDAPLLPQRASSSASSTRCAPPSRTPRSPPTSSSASRARPRRTSPQTLRVVEAVALLERLHLPVLHPRRHAGRDDGRPGAQGRGAGALRAAHRAAGAGRPGPRTAPSRAARSRCSSRPARAARTAPPRACRVGPATTGSCTSRCRRAPSARGPGTWSPSVSPTARRTTWWPTAGCRAGPMPCAAPRGGRRVGGAAGCRGAGQAGRVARDAVDRPAAAGARPSAPACSA